MDKLTLHDWHADLGARFINLVEMEAVTDYGDPMAEHAALSERAGVLDLSFRSRLCLTGADRKRFLHGQVTNEVNRLAVGEGCYAALVTAKGRMQSDLNIYCLPDELLLDFEPGLSQTVAQRLEKFIIADDVQVVDVAPHYGLLSVQGPLATDLLNETGLVRTLPAKPFSHEKLADSMLGETYLMNQPRLNTAGFDLFVPTASLRPIAEKLLAAARSVGGCPCGWQAFDLARIEAGIPRFGVDMDETNLPQECGIETRAVSYTKGCYIGQEVLNRIHTLGHVNRRLCGLRLADDLKTLPARGDKLFQAGKEVGAVTSAVASRKFSANLALGYLRREASRIGTELVLRADAGDSQAWTTELPFRAAP